ncbi:MAG: hypothetical protein HOM85_02750 [Euryarchaeota archaeon]|nr:hypothetical protein [Euryarchaeota archaeon]
MKTHTLSITAILVLSAFIPVFSANPIVADEFELFQKEVVLFPGLNESTAIPHKAGYRVDSASFDWELSPEIIDETWSLDMATYSSSIGNTTNLTSTSNGLILNQSTTGPTTAGTTNLHLFNNSNLQGFHAYDTLQLSCGIISCGSITATGNLTIHANEVVIDVSTTISGSDRVNTYLGNGGSESATNSWTGDGAGGGGHVGAGGNGGGSSTNGGSSYGNGTEPGSPGGGNSHPNGASTIGGNGGSVITIVAGSITINGSVTSEGGVGDNGPTPPNGGNGGNAAGGGSGGSIILKANTISIGSYGIVSSAGGDGGDGADAVWPTGPSLFLYHGGDGGGGGSGGFITMTTPSNGVSNSGTVDVSAGSGGDYGLKLGTGSDGIAGSNSVVGSTTYSTFPGFIYSSNNTSNYGSFLIPGLGDDDNVERAWINTTASVPAGAVLDMKYNYTMNGVDWSGWLNGNLSHQELPRFSNISFLYDFERSSAGLSPILTAIVPGSTNIEHMENLSIELEGQSILGPLDPDLVFGWIEEDGPLTKANPLTVPLSLDVPLNGTAISDFAMWMDLANNNITGSVTATFNSGYTISWSSADVVAGGIDLIIPMSVMQNEWPTVYNSTSEGIEWTNLNFSLSTSNLQAFGITNVSFHHTITGNLEFSSEMENHATSQCGSWYDATESCLDAYSIDVKGDPEGEMWNQTLELSNLNIAWVDDIEPQIQSVSHRVNGVDDADARHGETIVVIVHDKLAEDDLQGKIWAHTSPVTTWIELANLSPNPLIWNSQIQKYWGSVSTFQLDASIDHSIWFSVELYDAQGNSVILLNADSITVLPAIPSVSQLAIMTVDGELAENSNFSTPDNLRFLVKDANDRSDLNVEIELNSESSTQILQMVWNTTDSAYSVIWEPEFSDLGSWDVEVYAEEPNGGEIDEDGLHNGIDATFYLIDGIPPVILSATSTETTDEVRIDVQWEIEPGDTVSVWAFIFGPNSENIATKIIDQTSNGIGYTTLDKNTLSPGAYTAEIHVRDNFGNEVNTTINLVDIPVPLPIINSTNLSLSAVEESVILSGDVIFRTGEGTLNWVVDDEVWLVTPIMDGSLFEQLSLSNLSNSSHNIVLEICSIGECENYSQIIDATPWWNIEIIAFCSEANCSSTNAGDYPTTLRMISSKPSADYNCNETVVDPSLTLDVSCMLKDGKEVGNYVLDWRLEAQNRGGYWLLLEEGNHTFEVVEPELEPVEVEDDETPTDETAGSMFTGTTLGILGAMTLLIAGLLIFAFMKRREEDEFGAEEINLLDKEEIETPITEISLEEPSKFIESWDGLPGGGEYHDRDDGMWYETSEGVWWWRHPDGRFERV